MKELISRVILQIKRIIDSKKKIIFPFYFFYLLATPHFKLGFIFIFIISMQNPQYIYIIKEREE
jgi:hypothetical protein